MAHEHIVVDTDTHFSIDKATREISTQSGNAIIMQYDHNSERLTFELPKLIDGHDMTRCNEVQVHYINIDSASKDSNAGVYEVEDLQANPNDETAVILSWLISGNATKYAGVLNFLIKFKCVVDGKVEYAWNTAIYNGMTVSNGIDNGEIVVEEYADILEQWRNELFNGAGGLGGADWNAKEGEPGHVLNRPFYSEMGIGTVLAETSPVFSEGDGSFNITDPISFTPGNEYTVNWNGTEYTCTCIEFDLDGVTLPMLGNVGAVGYGDDTGEPFYIGIIPDEIAAEAGVYAQIMPLDGSTELTISITGRVETIQKIPVKYIPNTPVCIDVEWTQSTGSIVLDIDTTELVNAILNDAPIYINFASESNDLWDTERLVATPMYSQATTTYPFFKTTKEYVSHYLSAGVNAGSIPLTFGIYSVVRESKYLINIVPAT